MNPIIVIFVLAIVRVSTPVNISDNDQSEPSEIVKYLPSMDACRAK